MKIIFNIVLLLFILVALYHCPNVIHEQPSTMIDREEAQIEERRRVADEDMQRQATEDEEKRRREEEDEQRRRDDEE